MRVKSIKVSLTALMLLLFLFSISWPGTPTRQRTTAKSTGNTWDEKSQGGGTIFKVGAREFLDGYYIIYTDPYNWLIMDIGKINTQDGSTEAVNSVKAVQ